MADLQTLRLYVEKRKEWECVLVESILEMKYCFLDLPNSRFMLFFCFSIKSQQFSKYYPFNNSRSF